RADLRGWNLASRLDLGMATLCVVAPIGVVAVVLGTKATMRDYVLALGCSAVLTVYLCIIYDAGVVRPIARSVGELLRAIDRVHKGDFSERVPVTSIDEFGDLAA